MKRLTAVLCTVCLLAASAFAVAAEGAAVCIGVLDSGIQATHPALAEISMEPGKNLVFPDQSTYDLLGHGTRVAGLIAAQSEEITLVPFTISSRYPSGLARACTAKEVAAAMISAIDDYDCRILNLSLGFTEDFPALREAVAYAEERGVVVIAAAGNSGVLFPERVYYPAAYDTVIAVGAVDETGVIAPFSQQTYNFLCAPGVSVPVLSTGFSVKPPLVSGTSYAAATVTGIAAELLAEHPTWSPQELRDGLKEMAVSAADEWNPVYGWGVVGIELLEEQAA